MPITYKNDIGRKMFDSYFGLQLCWLFSLKRVLRIPKHFFSLYFFLLGKVLTSTCYSECYFWSKKCVDSFEDLHNDSPWLTFVGVKIKNSYNVMMSA